ncbi:slit homolog 3 protein-like [Ornithodoros turicata]|uniref:slit homolog 3 protein-like n=1 Tax=Ornithodoros turicata TaxID=34597 RepID=UPI00313A0C3E
MFVLFVMVMFLHVKCDFVATDTTLNDTQYCHTKTDRSGTTVFYKGAPNVEQLRHDLMELNIPRPFSLVVTDTNITTLPEFSFANLTLNVLRMVRCGIESLHTDSLVGLENVELLDLSKNSLTTVPSALAALKSLQLLYITFNRITTIGLELTRLSSSLTRINLNGNVISSIREDALKNMNRLLRFAANNNRIESIPKTLFSTAPRLQQIDLRWNLIEDVENLFDGLLELHTLKLEDNRIRHIRTLSASNLPSLESLSLDHNPIDTFTLFHSRNAAIESLSLQHCKISDVASIPFSCIDRLRFLRLRFNRIKHIDSDSFPKSVNTSSYSSITRRDFYPSNCKADNENKAGILLVIDISHNYIDAINNAFRGLQLLERLDIDNNDLENVPDDAFKSNINLKTLNMGYNKISWIGKHAFSSLVNLVVLKLSNNRLTSLNGSLYIMPMVKYLYLGNNRLLFLRENDFGSLPRLKMLEAQRNNISDVRGAFKNLVSLQYLYLHDNNLMVIHRASLPEDIKQLEKITIEGNILTCDCQLSWLYEIPQLYMYYDVPLCNSPPRLAGAPFLSNETRYNLDVWLEDCDERCTCRCMAEGYEGFIRVDCSQRNMKETPQKFPEDTAVIDLSGNLLDSLNTSLAKEAPAVRSLNLNNNLYTSLDWKVLPTNLSYLFLQNNSFKHFPLSVVDNLNLSGIWLSGNPWNCDCEDYAFRQWAESHEDTVRDTKRSALSFEDVVVDRVHLTPCSPSV